MELVDKFGRIATDLRVSITDRCNLRCTYCMPAEGMSWTPSEDILLAEEFERLVAMMIGLGVNSVRLTGGEPLVRPDVVDITRRLSMLPIDDLSITTNGVLLTRYAQALADAGLKRVNVSIDSLMTQRFADITRRNNLDRVLSGIDAAVAAGLTPVKLNCVVIKGTNDDEILDFARLARSTGYEVRFIEFLPLDASKKWKKQDVVSAKEVVERIEAHFPLVRADEESSAPATRYRFLDDSPGSIGVIPSVTESFCGTCNRVRLTADGQLRTCLFGLDETDLRTPMRAGATDEDLAALVTDAVSKKWAGHSIGTNTFLRPTRSMSAVGG